MSEDLKGTNVYAPIVPGTGEDRYPTHYSKYGKGGIKCVRNPRLEGRHGAQRRPLFGQASAISGARRKRQDRHLPRQDHLPFSIYGMEVNGM